MSDPMIGPEEDAPHEPVPHEPVRPRIRLVYELEESGARLVECRDERGRLLRYHYDDERGVVWVRNLNGSATEYEVPEGWMLVRVRHPESGEWVHACVPQVPPPGAASGDLAWPTRIVGCGATPLRAARKTEIPAVPYSGPGGITTVVYNPASRPRHDLRTNVISYVYSEDGKRLDPMGEA